MTTPGTTGGGRIAPRPVVVIGLITAICLLGDSSLYVILPSRLDVFAVSPTGAGLILGINRYIRIVSNTGAGWVFERAGFNGPFLFAVLLAAGTTLSYGLFTGFWALFIAHGLWGIAWSFLRLGGYLAVIQASGGTSMGRFMGVLQSVSRGGSLFAVVVGGILADAIGGRDVFLVFSVMTLAALALVPFSRMPRDLGRGRPRTDPSPRGQAPQPPPAPQATQPTQTTESTRVWRIRTLYAEAVIVWLLIPGLFVSTAGYLVRTVAGDGATLIGIGLGVGTLSGVLVGVRWIGDLGLGAYFGHLSDRLGRPRVILASAGAAAAAMTTVALSPTLAVALPAFTVIFLASTALQISLNASAAELAPADRRAAVLSRYATWADVGSGTGPLVGLTMVTQVGFGWAYGAGALLMGVAALLYWSVFVRRPA
jgi:MFS family permease